MVMFNSYVIHLLLCDIKLTGAKRREWMGCWGLLWWLLIVIMDHSLKFPAFSTSKKRVIASGKHFGNWKMTIFMDKPPTNGLLSIAMLDYERLSLEKKNDVLGKIDEPIFFPGTMWDFPLQFVVQKKCVNGARILGVFCFLRLKIVMLRTDILNWTCARGWFFGFGWRTLSHAQWPTECVCVCHSQVRRNQEVLSLGCNWKASY